MFSNVHTLKPKTAVRRDSTGASPAHAALLLSLATSAQAIISVLPEEMAQKQSWVQQHLLPTPGTAGLSRSPMAGSPSAQVLSTWAEAKRYGPGRESNAARYHLDRRGLQVSCVIVEYNDYPMVEWYGLFYNIGASATPILQNIQGLDTTFNSHQRQNLSSMARRRLRVSTSYQPYQIPLDPRV